MTRYVKQVVQGCGLGVFQQPAKIQIETKLGEPVPYVDGPPEHCGCNYRYRSRSHAAAVGVLGQIAILTHADIGPAV